MNYGQGSVDRLEAGARVASRDPGQLPDVMHEADQRAVGVQQILAPDAADGLRDAAQREFLGRRLPRLGELFHERDSLALEILDLPGSVIFALLHADQRGAVRLAVLLGFFVEFVLERL